MANLLYNSYQIVLFLKNVFNPIYVFLAKNQRTLNVVKIRNDDEECFFEKRMCLFLKAFFTKWEGAKYPGGSRPSCFVIIRKGENVMSWKSRSVNARKAEMTEIENASVEVAFKKK